MRCSHLIGWALLAALALSGCHALVPGKPIAGHGRTATSGESFALSCSYPVDGHRDTAATVLKRFGREARRERLFGPEGAELDGIVLWPGRPERRLELILDEQPRERVLALRVYGAAARWRYQDLGIGTSLAAVAAMNGKPFTFWGFDWDYGGAVSDWNGGSLDQPDALCNVSASVTPDPDLAELSGEVIGDVAVQSDNPAAIKAKPQISEITLHWP